MLVKGSFVKLVAVDKVKEIVDRLEIIDWYPDDIDTSSLGICEGLAYITRDGHKLYNCRFPWEYLHMCGKFYSFEIEEVRPC